MERLDFDNNGWEHIFDPNKNISVSARDVCVVLFTDDLGNEEQNVRFENYINQIVNLIRKDNTIGQDDAESFRYLLLSLRDSLLLKYANDTGTMVSVLPNASFFKHLFFELRGKFDDKEFARTKYIELVDYIPLLSFNTPPSLTRAEKKDRKRLREMFVDDIVARAKKIGYISDDADVPILDAGKWKEYLTDIYVRLHPYDWERMSASAFVIMQVFRDVLNSDDNQNMHERAKWLDGVNLLPNGTISKNVNLIRGALQRYLNCTYVEGSLKCRIDNEERTSDKNPVSVLRAYIINGEDFALAKIQNVGHFNEESCALGHCLAEGGIRSRWLNELKKGRIEVYSFCKFTGDKRIPLVTILVNPRNEGAILQIRRAEISKDGRIRDNILIDGSETYYNELLDSIVYLTHMLSFDLKIRDIKEIHDTMSLPVRDGKILTTRGIADIKAYVPSEGEAVLKGSLRVDSSIPLSVLDRVSTMSNIVLDMTHATENQKNLLKQCGGMLIDRSHSAIYPNLETVADNIRIENADRVEMPNLTTVNGNMYLINVSDITMDNLSRIERNLVITGCRSVMLPTLLETGVGVRIDADAIYLPSFRKSGWSLFFPNATSIHVPALRSTFGSFYAPKIRDDKSEFHSEFTVRNGDKAVVSESVAGRVMSGGDYAIISHNPDELYVPDPNSFV